MTCLGLEGPVPSTMEDRTWSSHFQPVLWPLDSAACGLHLCVKASPRVVVAMVLVYLSISSVLMGVHASKTMFALLQAT